ncbi:MAG: LPS assembly protein LptD [Verrucomicrobiales bacterium]
MFASSRPFSLWAGLTAAAVASIFHAAPASGQDLLDALTSKVQIEALETSINPETGVAEAKGEVHIKYEDVEIFANEAEYYGSSGDIHAKGDVEIYKAGLLYRGAGAIYNIETEEITANDLRGGLDPLYFDAGEFKSPTTEIDVINLTDTELTTHDSATPNYHFKAKAIDIYPDDRVVFRKVTVYAGNTPVLWLPYFSQPFDEELGYIFTPGYSSNWGMFLLNQYGVMIGDHTIAQYKLDLRSERGIAGGITLKSVRHREKENFGEIQLYYAQDSDPTLTRTGVRSESSSRSELDQERYRVNVQHRIYLPGPEESTFYVDIDINKLSDEFFYEDFFPSEFRLDPQPDNVVSIVKQFQNAELNVLGRFQVNDFFQTDTRLPEIALDFVRQPIFAGLFYEGETSLGIYEENMADAAVRRIQNTISSLEEQLADPLISTLDPTFDEAEARSMLDSLRAQIGEVGFTRFHTYHQVLYPKMLGGWLSLVPRVGIGATAYTDVAGDGASDTRMAYSAGFEASFKMTKEYNDVQIPSLGVDEIRHIAQPYMEYSYLTVDGMEDGFRSIDRLVPSTRLRPLNVSQFTAIDDLASWNVLRLGMRNTLQTRRGTGSYNWLTLNSYFDSYFDDPEFDRDFSNFFNEVRWDPLPWLRVSLDSQVPVFGGDFDFLEVGSRVTFMPTSNFEFTVGHRWLEDHPFFEDSSQIDLRAYWRVTDNWGLGASQRYEFDDSTLELQQYSIHRDLTSWTASLGAMIQDHRGENEYGIVFMLSLKDFPQVNIPLNIDPSGGN